MCSSLTIQFHQGNPPPLLPEFPPAELDVPVPAQPEIPTLQGRIVVLNEFSPTIPPPEVDVPVLIGLRGGLLTGSFLLAAVESDKSRVRPLSAALLSFVLSRESDGKEAR